ncbi:protein-glutamate O-methyltransferase CheR [Ectobacillus antri]|uniref:Protein-glutamate O-methyltransferase CheR n=1 Tax=Ectobacillus antri TaxID=2486280 RepID=A0ABT6H269_9BACI|nr:protein-glutamate O-methyltransferase CheR [Ectobacillus antri]MDG4656183.1 protein-glutamate O-methyltransferase CheR [Ectobacillus antri]MDG5752858.1 protein-glutamate O-methyltransferase CheR [Ectobacillus antri]
MTSEEHAYLAFCHRLKIMRGIDLSLYKQDRMKRRVDSFLLRQGFQTYEAFLQALNSELFNIFVDYLTIHVSNFFRNYVRWTILQQDILPLLSTDYTSLKIWSAACSSGEEPYTLAMILEHMRLQYHIHATDIDPHIIKVAKTGVYHERSLSEVPALFRDTYFTRQHDSYTINKTLQKQISFEQHDLLTDTFAQNYDLIVCRNVMIYFTEEARNMVYQKFSNALRPGGVLFVGSTEQILSPEKYQFKIIQPFFYQKI